jgi:hypothetical protein
MVEGKQRSMQAARRTRTSSGSGRAAKNLAHTRRATRTTAPKDAARCRFDTVSKSASAARVSAREQSITLVFWGRKSSRWGAAAARERRHDVVAAGGHERWC